MPLLLVFKHFTTFAVAKFCHAARASNGRSYLRAIKPCQVLRGHLPGSPGVLRCGVMVPRRSLRAGTLVLLLLHLGLSGAEASNPFGEFKSKQEAVAAFEEVERAQQAGNKVCALCVRAPLFVAAHDRGRVITSALNFWGFGAAMLAPHVAGRGIDSPD